MTDEIKEKLISMSDSPYRKFHSKLLPDTKNILGIRLPKIRAYAKELAKNIDILECENDVYYEETMLRGMIIGYMKADVETRLKYISDFVPRIDNWAVCDSFCNTLKFTSKNRERVWEFLQPYAHSQNEFEQRFCAVMLLSHFINDEYIDKVLALLTEINTEKYYSSMAAVWALAECYIKFPEKTLPYIYQFDSLTVKRTVRKICDSYRVEKDTKYLLKKEFLNDKGNS